MNEAQRQAIKNRQRTMAREMTADDEPAAPPKPVRTTEEITADLIARYRPPVGDGKPVEYLRFVDKSMKCAGMQSGDQVTARVQPNGMRHTIEFIEGLNCFLVGYIEPARDKAVYDMVERASVKTWRPAAP